MESGSAIMFFVFCCGEYNRLLSIAFCDYIRHRFANKINTMLNLEEEKSKFRFKMKLDIRWSDMDEMRHVNNAVYHTYTEQARINYFHDTLQLDWTKASFILASAHIDYLKPLVFPSEAYIYLRCTKFGTKSFELQYLITVVEKGVENLSASVVTTLVMFDYKTNKTEVMPESIKETIRNYEPIKI